MNGQANLIRMTQVLRLALCLGGLLLIAPWVHGQTSGTTKQTVVPLPHAHAHNDYEHQRPLLDAIEQGFCNVEADIYWQNGRLLVGHDLEDLKPERTLEELYLKPLWQRFQQIGSIYQDGPPLTLLIDQKSEAETTYAALDEALKPYRAMLVRYEQEEIRTGAVAVILSGNRPTETVAKQNPRWVAIDGRLSDLAANPSVSLMPLISDRWNQHFFWTGDGELPADDANRLKDVVRQAHAQGRRIRFWATPDREVAWRTLRNHQVDLINTDDLMGLGRFLRDSSSEPRP